MFSRERKLAREERLIEWVKRPLPPVYDGDATRCSATKFFTWGQWYAHQVTEGLSPSIRMAVSDYLDEELSVEHMIFCVETDTSPLSI